MPQLKTGWVRPLRLMVTEGAAGYGSLLCLVFVPVLSKFFVMHTHS